MFTAAFEPLTAEVGDLLNYDYQRVFAGAKRVMAFWDAHDFDIAECVLGVIAPIVADRPHVFLMHDMSDTRYSSAQTDYGGQRLWHGENAGTARFRLGIIDSAVAQAISAQDFTARNRITLDSADHCIDLELNQVPGRVQEIQTLLRDELFAMQAHWFWFSLNEHPGPSTFPRFALGERSLRLRRLSCRTAGIHRSYSLRRIASPPSLMYTSPDSVSSINLAYQGR
jgi:hypothetical protein